MKLIIACVVLLSLIGCQDEPAGPPTPITIMNAPDGSPLMTITYPDTCATPITLEVWTAPPSRPDPNWTPQLIARYENFHQVIYRIPRSISKLSAHIAGRRPLDLIAPQSDAAAITDIIPCQ